MQLIVKRHYEGGNVEYVQSRATLAEGKELRFTENENEAKTWRTFYAAVDFIAKSATSLEGIEITNLELAKRGETTKPKEKTKGKTNAKAKAADETQKPPKAANEKEVSQ